MSPSDQDDGVSVKRSLDKEDEWQISKGNTNEDNLSHDATDIVAFCVHAIGIPESQLSLENLKQVGCTLEEVEAVTTHLESGWWYKQANGEKVKEAGANLGTP